jgi:hypothetical protein
MRWGSSLLGSGSSLLGSGLSSLGSGVLLIGFMAFLSLSWLWVAAALPRGTVFSAAAGLGAGWLLGSACGVALESYGLGRSFLVESFGDLRVGGGVFGLAVADEGGFVVHAALP